MLSTFVRVCTLFCEDFNRIHQRISWLCSPYKKITNKVGADFRKNLLICGFHFVMLVIEDSIYREPKLDVDSQLDKHWTGLDLLLFHPVLVLKLFSPNPGLDNICPAQSKDN
jgi:hypothetical protein